MNFILYFFRLQAYEIFFNVYNVHFDSQENIPESIDEFSAKTITNEIRDLEHDFVAMEPSTGGVAFSCDYFLAINVSRINRIHTISELKMFFIYIYTIHIYIDMYTRTALEKYFLLNI